VLTIPLLRFMTLPNYAEAQLFQLPPLVPMVAWSKLPPLMCICGLELVGIEYFSENASLSHSSSTILQPEQRGSMTTGNFR